MSMHMDRILVVDDDGATRAMLTYLLRDEGFAVEAVHETGAAMEALERERFDLLLLDVEIDTLDGFKLLSNLRRRPDCPAAIFLSGHGEREARLRAFELGALDYMTKPVDVYELVARVRVALRRKPREARGASTINHTSRGPGYAFAPPETTLAYPA